VRCAISPPLASLFLEQSELHEAQRARFHWALNATHSRIAKPAADARAQIMVVKNLLERDHATMRLMLTEQGRAVLSVLLSRSGIKLPASR
jgi:hypothetical protein